MFSCILGTVFLWFGPKNALKVFSFDPKRKKIENVSKRLVMAQIFQIFKEGFFFVNYHKSFNYITFKKPIACGFFFLIWQIFDTIPINEQFHCEIFFKFLHF